MDPKYRVGKKQGRAILEIATGHEYLIFPEGKEEAAQNYCAFLNGEKMFSAAEVKQILLDFTWFNHSDKDPRVKIVDDFLKEKFKEK